MKKKIGYTFLALSFLLWLVIPALPFLGFSGSEMAAATAGLIIAAEVAFYLSIILLGREAWNKIKSWFWKKGKEGEGSEQETTNPKSEGENSENENTAP